MAKPTEVTTKPVRVSYPNLDKPKPKNDKPGATPFYSAMLLLPPSYDLAPFRAAMQAAVKEEFGDKVPSKEKMAPYGNPIRKVDEKRDDETGKLPIGMEEGGHFLSVSNRQRVAVAGRDASMVVDPEKIKDLIYGGCWCNFHLRAFAWSYEGKWGVSFSLEAVQFVRDDEPFGRKITTETFAPISGDAPAAAAGDAASDQDALFG